jgi:hypothetical protein
MSGQRAVQELPGGFLPVPQAGGLRGLCSILLLVVSTLKVATCSCVAGVISLWVRLLAVILDDLDDPVGSRIMPTGSKSFLCFDTIPRSLGRRNSCCSSASLSWLKSAEDMVGLDEYISRMKPGGGVFLHSTS